MVYLKMNIKQRNQYCRFAAIYHELCVSGWWSVHVVKVLRDPEGFVNATVVKGKLSLCPGLDGKNIV